jgi:hypothetical protein
MNSQLKWALGIGLATFFLLGAAAAYAYWTANGSGSGTAPVGTTTDNLSIASPSVTGIGPGARAPVAVTVTNPKVPKGLPAGSSASRSRPVSVGLVARLWPHRRVSPQAGERCAYCLMSSHRQ